MQALRSELPEKHSHNPDIGTTLNQSDKPCYDEIIYCFFFLRLHFLRFDIGHRGRPSESFVQRNDQKCGDWGGAYRGSRSLSRN